MTRTLSKFMVLLMLVAGSTLPSAAESLNALKVMQKDGTELTFYLDQKPQVLFQGDYLVVKTETSQTWFFMYWIQRFTYDLYEEDEDGINVPDGDPSGFNYKDGVILMSKLKKNAAVGIYTPDGKMLRQFTANNDGTCRLSLSTLPKGVYLIKAGNLTYKITR